KWPIILLGFIVIFLIGGIIQSITRHDPDVSFMYIGAATVTVDGTNELESTVEEIIDDYNGDEYKKVDYLEFTALTDNSNNVIFDADHNKKVLQRFFVEIAAGDSIIYLVDDYYYNMLLGKEQLDVCVLAKLSDVLDDADMPVNALDEYGVFIKDLDIYKTEGFNQLPESTILCIRRSPEQDEVKYGRTMDVYNNNKKCFIKLITYKAPQED
ncbi:MAG: hypothetical protein PHD46_04915, partial [Eubacteriales bacterium]|nr:hypothetical protein [Eubacteriales bacterium]